VLIALTAFSVTTSTPPPGLNWISAGAAVLELNGRAESGIGVRVPSSAIRNPAMFPGPPVLLHGEMDALENAGRQPASVYARSTIYTTLSPCAMCTGALLLYGIPHVVIGENSTFRGEEDLLRARGVNVEVLQDERCIEMMQQFISEHPALWNEDIGV